MDPETHTNLVTVLREEAFDCARYTVMAAEAREEGDTEAAELLDGIADIGLRVHFTELAKLAHLVGGDADNLAAAIQHESSIREESYRLFAEQARAAGETDVADRLEAIRADKLDDVQALERALEHLQAPA